MKVLTGGAVVFAVGGAFVLGRVTMATGPSGCDASAKLDDQYQVVINDHGHATNNQGQNVVLAEFSGESRSTTTVPSSEPVKAAQRMMIFQGNTIADIAEKAAPAVVNIDVETPDNPMVALRQFGGGMDDLNRFPFFGGPIVPRDIYTKPRRGTGSGFIVRSNGYILTNRHVVLNATTIKVTLKDKRQLNATVVGSDSFSDLAIIKIDADNLPVLNMGTSKDLRPGEFAIAIGSPLGYDHTVTLGIISAIERHVTDINGDINFIQTDAAINQGNSGGPLLNLNGEVIGVNTAINKAGQNIGFSVPVDVAKVVAEHLIERKKILRPYLGLRMADRIDANTAHRLNVKPGQRGVFIAGVNSNSPAESGGIQQKDIIISIDGKEMDHPENVRDYVKAHAVKDVLKVTVLRSGTTQELTVQIGEYPGSQVDEDE
jgi:Trypsin-like serine proteases, typically periplasmic, contain C-terminal PDZ domain